MKLAWPPRYGDEVLDYVIDWTAALNGDTISSVTAEALDGGTLTIGTISTAGAETTVWISGGGTAEQRDARIVLLATTAGNRTINATVSLPVLGR
jgi:subtilisin family serine protease